MFGEYVEFSANTTRRLLRDDAEEEDYDAISIDEYEYEYDVSLKHHEGRRLFHFSSCPPDCRQYPYRLYCHAPICCQRGGSHRRRLSSNATFSFDVDLAREAMAEALQGYVASSSYQLQTSLATQQDYTTAVAKWDFPVVGCVTEYFGPLCSFRTYFGYPDTLYISYWYVNQTSGSVVDVNAYFSKMPSDYLRTLFIMGSNSCQAAIEATFGEPNFCTSCIVLTNTTFDVDCSNLYTDLGIVEFGHLYKGAHDPNTTLFPSFFPMQVYQSWLPKN